MSLSYVTTPVQVLNDPLFASKNLTIAVKREDLNHAHISGNKWWKLKLNLARALHSKTDGVLTFGGAYSNHIYATAAAAKEVGLKSVGIIRGEEVYPLNSTLNFAARQGMILRFVDRNSYRNKTDSRFLEQLRHEFPNFSIIPEGGTNELAVEGVEEFTRVHLSKIEFDDIILPVGTGGTIAGIINGLPKGKRVLGISMLKGGDFLKDDINRFLKHNIDVEWQLLTDYHCGGYAKTNPELDQFITIFEKTHGIPLEHVYSGKAMFALSDLIKNDFFDPGRKILFLHTGGLQGKTKTT